MAERTGGRHSSRADSVEQNCADGGITFRSAVLCSSESSSAWTICIPISIGRTMREDLAKDYNGLPDNEPVNTVREDPERKGLLFAGTGRTLTFHSTMEITGNHCARICRRLPFVIWSFIRTMSWWARMAVLSGFSITSRRFDRSDQE